MPLFRGSMSGAERLRALRLQRGLTQMDIRLLDVMAQSNYSRVESGKAHPTRKNLDALLDLYDASFDDRVEITKYFGYLPPYPLPNAEEIAAACQRCQPILDSVPMPAYLMDFVSRFLAWNTCFSRLLGVHEGSGVLEELRYMPLFKAQFDSRVRLSAFMDNMETTLRAEMQGIRERLAPYEKERWYAGFVADLCQDAEFQKYWQVTQDAAPSQEKVSEFADRALQPVRFDLPGFDTQLHFYANLDAMIGDHRFEIVYLIPSDAFTLRQVERWLAEMP